MGSILDKIVAHKRQEIANLKVDRAAVAACPPPLDFLAALTAGDQRNRVSLIAEVKKASPSKGVIRPDFDPAQIARAYQSAGVQCISVLTDEHFFQGHLDFLSSIRQATTVPLLRKDFVLSPEQVYQARLAGADAVLLIAECLEPGPLRELHDLIVELGMTPLVELYDRRNLEAVLDCQPRLVGVNNRDLNTFEVDLEHSIRLRSEIPESIAMVSESGIFTAADVSLMQQHGIDAILVGESLMRSPDIPAAVTELMSPAPTSVKFRAPARDEYHEFYHKYIELVTEDSVLPLLDSQPDQLRALLGRCSPDDVNRLHEPYTWTLKQVVGHLIDAERTFSERMLRIGVGDTTPIPGIDQQMYVRGIDYRPLEIGSLLDEFEHLRRANRLAVDRLSPNALVRVGVASDSRVSARANLYMLVGHVEYHRRIIQQRLS